MNQKIVEQYFTLNWSKETLDNFGFTRSCSQIGLLFNRSREKTHTQLSNPVEFFCGLLTLNYKTKERLVSPALCGLSKRQGMYPTICVSARSANQSTVFLIGLQCSCVYVGPIPWNAFTTGRNLLLLTRPVFTTLLYQYA